MNEKTNNLDEVVINNCVNCGATIISSHNLDTSLACQACEDEEFAEMHDDTGDFSEEHIKQFNKLEKANKKALVLRRIKYNFIRGGLI